MMDGITASDFEKQTIPTLEMPRRAGSLTSMLVLLKRRRNLKREARCSRKYKFNGTEVSCKKPTLLDSGFVVGSGHTDCDAK